MAKLVEQKNYFTFVSGLNTEGGYLTSPPNTWKEGFNVIPKINGELHRRKGIDYESGWLLSGGVTLEVAEDLAHVTNEWNSVGGDGSRNFLVVQIGPTVQFYDNTGNGISATEKSFFIDLTAFSTNSNISGTAPISTASGNGKLIIVSADTEPIVVTYDADLDSISVEALTLQVRDFEGLDDGLTVDNRPVVLSNEHNYNLRNQGWPSAHITAYQAAIGLYPSNAQVWTAGKNASDVFTPSFLDLQDFGNTPAPKGKFILDLFNRSRFPVSVEIEDYRPTTVAFFAGRAWYAGMNSDTLSSWILFSQVADTSDKFGYAYQEADPTSEFISDLVASDGGVIPIQDVGTVLKLLPLADSILVLADNGIWQIVGGASGFSADSYSVNKISAVGCVSAKSVVEVENTAMFWGIGGIYAFTQETNLANITSGTYAVAAVTDTTIQEFYSRIPVINRAFSSGQYNQEERVIYWVFNNDPEADGVNNRFRKNSILCFDIRLKAFYVHEIEPVASRTPYILDVFVTRGGSSTSAEHSVLAGVDDVDSDAPADVVASISSPVLNTKATKFWAEVQHEDNDFQYTVADMDNGRQSGTRYKDWVSKDTVGADVIPYIITGFDLTNVAGSRQVQGSYCLAYCKKTEEGVDENDLPINPSSVLLQVRWDWTDTATAGRWSANQQVYRHKRLILLTGPLGELDTGYGLVVTKNKIRGYGRAVQFKWLGEADKDFKMAGWAILYLAEENI